MKHKQKTRLPPFIICMDEYCPYMWSDFKKWMLETHIKEAETLITQELIGYILEYISNIYNHFPKLLTEGEYDKCFPLDQRISNKELTEFEKFLSNIMAELIRIENQLFKDEENKKN